MKFICIIGYRGAGKSTVAGSIKKQFESEAIIISAENYYKDLDRLPTFGDGLGPNFDCPEAVDHEFLFEQLTQLKQNRPIQMPKYEFSTCIRQKYETINPKKIVIVEGLFTLTHAGLRDFFDLKLFVNCNKAVALARSCSRDLRNPPRFSMKFPVQQEPTNTRDGASYVGWQRKYVHLTIENTLGLDKLSENIQPIYPSLTEMLTPDSSKFDFKKGSIFVISGPAGVGKSTTIKALTEHFPSLKKPIFFTTRAMRKGEVDRIDYHFINSAQFKDLEQRGEFLLTLEFNNTFYGISKKDIKTLQDNGADIILDVSSKPAKMIKDYFSEARLIFLMPDDARILIKRLAERNTKGDEVFARLQMAKEMTYASQYDFTVINHHGKLQDTIIELCRIVTQEKLTKGLRAANINDISFDLFRINILLFLAILRKHFPQFYEQRYSRSMQKILFFSFGEEVTENPKIAAALERHATMS